MFLAEKNIDALPTVQVDLMAGEHKTAEYRRKNPLSESPALELDDGRVLTESRAICAYLEHLYPQPNLLGNDPEERAFVEMWDRRVELNWFVPMTMWVRHSHPGLKVLEPVQLSEYAGRQAQRARAFSQWLDSELSAREFLAGDRFTIADITGFAGLEFCRGLMKFRVEQEGLPNLARWRESIAARPSASAD